MTNVGDWRSANGLSHRDVQAKIRKHQAEGSAEANPGYDQSSYLNQLNGRVNATVIAGAWNGKSAFGSGNGTTVMIHPDFLRTMHNDSELGAYYEEQINILAEEDAKMKKQAEASGWNIISSGHYIDENGEMSGYAHVETTVETPSDKKKKSAKELMEELKEQLEEKMAAKMENEERLEEKREARQKLLEYLRTESSTNVTHSVKETAAGPSTRSETDS